MVVFTLESLDLACHLLEREGHIENKHIYLNDGKDLRKIIDFETINEAFREGESYHSETTGYRVVFSDGGAVEIKLTSDGIDVKDYHLHIHNHDDFEIDNSASNYMF
ncbi:MAG: hypothetical protein V7782_02650 [Psychromonas sp.]